MDKNSIIGIVLIAGILILFGIFNQPSKEELARRQHIQDSLTVVRFEQAKKDSLKQENVEIPVVTEKIPDTINQSQLKQTLDDFSLAASGENDFYTLESDLLKVVISKKGGRPYSVELKKYKTFDSLPLVLFTGDSTIFGFDFFYKNKYYIATNDLFFQPVDTVKKSVVVNDSASWAMRLYAGENRYIEYVYTLKSGSYEVGFKANLVGLDDISTRSPEAMDLTWEIYSPQQEKGKANENTYTTLYYKHFKDEVESFNAKTKKEDQRIQIPTKIEWIAFKDQFFSSVIMADEAFDNAELEMIGLPEENRFLKHFKAEIEVPFIERNKSLSFNFFFGPNKFSLLKEYKDKDLKELVTLGKSIIRWINQYVIIPIFDWLSKYMGNYGIIILLLTLIIKIGLLPLTYRSYVSMAKMRVLKPQIDELNAKYPKGKEMEKQQATMALYRKAGASPFGGCLPQLLQFPILFAMFRFFPTSIELRQEGFLWAKDLSTYDSILDLPFTVPLGYGDHVSLFTILMTVTTILSIKQSNQTTASTQQMPGMKGMMYIMPVMFMFFLNSFSAGLTYYYFLTNIISFGQNWLFKLFLDEEKLLKKMEARKAKPVKKSNFQKRMEEMAKKRGYQVPKKK